MGRINWKRVFLGGLVWWAVFHLLGVAARLLYLAEEVTAAWKALGLHFSLTPGFAVFWLVLTYGGGVISIWLYAAIQPRYGPGPTTALRAGLTAWFGSFVYVMFLGWAGVFSMRFVAIAVTTDLVMLVVATVLGARSYREAE